MPSDTGSSSESPDIKKEAYRQVFYEIVESLIIDVCFKVHRGVKMDYFPVDEYIISEKKFYKTDAYGRSDELQQGKSTIDRKQQVKPLIVMCPRCEKPHGTDRLATHLYTCMKGGRQSRSKNAPNYSDGFKEDIQIDEDDERDATFGQSSKKKKKKPTAKKAKAKPLPKYYDNCGPSTVDLISFGTNQEVMIEQPQEISKSKSGAKPRRVGTSYDSFTFSSPVKMHPPENLFEEDNGQIDVDTIDRDDDLLGTKKFIPRYYPHEEKNSAAGTLDGDIHF